MDTEKKRTRKPHKAGCKCRPCVLKRTGKLSADCPRIAAQVSHEVGAWAKASAEKEGLTMNAWLGNLVEERFKAAQDEAET